MNKEGPEQIVREEVGGESTVLETKTIYMERNIERTKRKQSERKFIGRGTKNFRAP